VATKDTVGSARCARLQALFATQTYNLNQAYMLMSASLTPLWGRLSDVIGRKICLHFSIFVFLLGSALCGAAQSFVWLAVCRGLQGAGAGGTIQMVLIVIADIVPLEERGKFAGYLGATWGVSSVIGPLVGGVLSDHGQPQSRPIDPP